MGNNDMAHKLNTGKWPKRNAVISLPQIFEKVDWLLSFSPTFVIPPRLWLFTGITSANCSLAQTNLPSFKFVDVGLWLADGCWCARWWDGCSLFPCGLADKSTSCLAFDPPAPTPASLLGLFMWYKCLSAVLLLRSWGCEYVCAWESERDIRWRYTFFFFFFLYE